MNDEDTLPFNADEFMQSTVDSAMVTDYQLCPEGTFPALIDDFDSSAFERISFEYKKGPKAGEKGSMTKFNCPFSIQDASVLSKMERDRVVVEWQMIIDRTPEGGLDFGKDRNVKLGQLREAVGQNAPGPWNFPMLRGKGPLMVKVVHESFKRSDGTDGKAARVVRVAPLR